MPLVLKPHPTPTLQSTKWQPRKKAFQQHWKLGSFSPRVAKGTRNSFVWRICEQVSYLLCCVTTAGSLQQPKSWWNTSLTSGRGDLRNFEDCVHHLVISCLDGSVLNTMAVHTRDRAFQTRFGCCCALCLFLRTGTHVSRKYWCNKSLRWRHSRVHQSNWKCMEMYNMPIKLW